MRKISIAACSIALFSLLGLPSVSSAQFLSTQLSVSASTVIHETPPSITINWTAEDSAKSYIVSRMGADGSWASKGTVGKGLTWTDKDVQPGVGYEYRIQKVSSVKGQLVAGYGYVYSGINLPAREFSGTVELIVDDTFATALSSELSRLQADLVADGWKVRRHDVKRSDSVEAVKKLILTDFNTDSTVRSVFLFGHVPVPYSGELNPDGHPNHLGAWPADMYYGDMYGDYTDISTTTGAGILPGNKNVPGDGRFDQTSPSGAIDLEIGRVDMWDMPAFASSEKELLRNYLNKDHGFRTGALRAEKKALISDNFGSYGEGFASDGWRNFPNFVGAENIVQTGWFTTLDTARCLWAYGCGGGSFTSAGGIGTTTDFAINDIKAIFTLLFGSYFGDWNVENSFLRAPLASSSTLTCGWGGRPHWYLHHMAMGETIGFGVRLTQNNVSNTYDPGYGAGMMHIALMGDPTLRMSYAHPASSYKFVTATALPNKTAKISWQSDSTADGYNVYRMHYNNEVYLKVNATPVAGNSLVDATPYSDSNYYIVRAIAKSGGSGGSYYVSGQASNPVIVTFTQSGVAEKSGPASNLKISQDGPFVNISLSRTTSETARLSIFDIAGREIKVIDGDLHNAGVMNYMLNTSDLSAMSAGVYFVRVLSSSSQLTERFIYRK